MSQRDMLENSVDLLNTLRGPAVILTAPFTLAFPVRLEQVIDPTGGAAATGWTRLGFTRGGINVVKTIAKQVLSDIDQIVGEYSQVRTNTGYRITSQIAEAYSDAQTNLAMEYGTATQVSTTGATQMMTPMDNGSLSSIKRRVAVVYPKNTDGRALAFIFRNSEPAGGDKTWRFDKSDAVSPALELIAFPEIATTIPAEQRYGVKIDLIGG